MYAHEREYRGEGADAKLAELQLAVYGVGAIGSNLVDNLVRQGFQTIQIFDKDRVEEGNVGTQIYGRRAIGMTKVSALKNEVYMRTGVSVMDWNVTIDANKIKHRGFGVQIDCFDNHDGRQVVQDHARENGLDCLHIGLNADYAEVIWDEKYTVPEDVNEGDNCDYPLARNIVMLAVAVASECLVEFALEGTKRSFRMTLRDRQIREVL